MKRVACLSFVLMMGSMGVLAHGHHDREEPFATSTYSSAAEGAHSPYTISTDNFNSDFDQLSLYANLLLEDGNIDANTDGLELEEEGDYEFHFSTVLVNEEDSPLVLEVYLAVNGVVVDSFFYGSPPIGATGTFLPGELQEISGFGYLKDLEEDSFITLEIANVNGGNGEDVLVLGWTVSARKIDGRHRHHDEEPIQE